MNCMKCGRETVSEQVFCEGCQLEMEKYPVRPGTVVQLPSRKNLRVEKKAPKKKTVSLEDQIANLRRLVRTLLILLVLISGLLAWLGPKGVEHLLEDNFKIGQNYQTITPTTAAAEP